MRFTKTILASLIVFMATTVWSQQPQYGSVSGSILDNETKVPIPFSSLYIHNLSTGTIADSIGNFEMPNLNPDVYQIVISAMGYETLQKSILITAGKELKINFLLHKNSLELGELVVEGISKETSIEMKGFAVDAIETKQIKSQSIHLNDLLNQTSGIKVRQSGGLGSRTTYNMNGLSGNAIRFFLDGVPMEFYGSSYSISNIPAALIERMEVYKGVVPVELGNDALGGAVNIVSKSSADNSLNYSHTFGSFNTHQALLNGNWRHSKTGFSVKGSVFYNYSDNNYKIWGDNIYVTDPNTFEIKRGIKVRRFHDGYQSLGPKLDVGFSNKSWADQLYVGLLYSQLNKENQHGATMDVPFGERTYNQTTFMPNLTYLKNNFITKGLNINIFSAYSVLSRNLVDTTANQYNWYGDIVAVKPGGGEHSGPSLSETNEKIYLNRINLAYHFNDNNEIGANYLLTDFERKGDDPVAPPDRRVYGDVQKLKKDVAGFSYRNTSFHERLKTTLFAKYYHYAVNVVDAVYENSVFIPYNRKKNDHTLGYGLALSLNLVPKLTVQSSFEKATRLPETNEIFGNDSENINPAYELSPETSVNANLGTRLGPFIYRDHQLTISNNFFYRNVSDLIQQANLEGAIDSYVFINLEKILSKGIDVDVKYNYRQVLDFYLSMSYADARDITPMDNKGRINKHYLARIPNQPFFQVNHSLRYSFNNLIQKNAIFFVYWNSNYVHQFYRKWENIGKDNKDIIPAQFVHHLGLGYTFPNKKLSMAIDAKNILNEQAYDNFAIQQPGRAFYVKLNYTLMK